ncbi:MAG: XRE family transcriptional regulator, partial [Pseudomonadota bacterium]|nr:XRE family transcriptional regulator [Pseudomonadota bacterium]
MTGENTTVARDLEARIGAEIRRQRKRRDMTVASLADAAGLSQGMLSKIETGQTSASLATLSRLAEALTVPLSALFSATEQSSDVSFVPAGEGIHIERRGSRANHLYQLLGHVVRGQLAVEPYLITLDADAEIYEDFAHEGVEFIHMLEGQIDYRHASQVFTRRPGDSLFFDARAPHGPTALAT